MKFFKVLIVRLLKYYKNNVKVIPILILLSAQQEKNAEQVGLHINNSISMN